MSRRGTKKQTFVGIIADEDTVTGFLLAGIGESDVQNGENWLVVTNKTPQQKIEDAFKKLTSRDDLTILLISQQAANEIRHLLDAYDQMLPTILEVPTPAHPYDVDKDSTMHRINRLLGAQ